MPFAFHLADNGDILQAQASRPEQADGTPGPGWVWCAPEQFRLFFSYAWPRWTGTDIVDAPPPGLSLADLKASALEEYQNQAAQCIDEYLPQPWDRLRDVATPEFAEWCAEFLALVATELSRLEAAVAAATTEAELEAIVPDWPEVDA